MFAGKQMEEKMTEYIVTTQKKKNSVKILGDDKLEFEEQIINFRLEQANAYCFLLKLDNKVHEVLARKLNTGEYEINIHGKYIITDVKTRLQEKAKELLLNRNGEILNKAVKAPMPGMILKIHKKIGEPVQAGEAVLVLEAMKMENEIKSASSGVIKDIKIRQGNKVEKDEILMLIS